MASDSDRCCGTQSIAELIVDFVHTLLMGDANSGVVDTYDIDCIVELFNGGGEGAGPALLLRYDAENRLIVAEPEFPHGGSEKVKFTYDYLGRRVRKQVFDYDDANEVWLTTPKRERRFMYADWRPVLELDGSNGVIRKYTWGRDLSGSLDAAGGIGGLVAIEDPNDPADATDPNGEFIVLADANGNVGQLVEWSATYVTDDADSILPARYAYTPYGQLRSSLGDYASENPMRFSTKYWDDETGFGYWGYRYYDPATGRWINRDPIVADPASLVAVLEAQVVPHEELQAYGYVTNAPTEWYDAIGLSRGGKCNIKPS